MNVSTIEAIWFAINLFAGVVTLLNLVSAYRGWRAVAGTSEAWRVQAWANLRREIVVLLEITALLIIVIPALFAPGDTPLTLLILVFMVVPAGLALNSYLDGRARRTLARLL